jgi:hypothetical protein
MKGTSSKRTGDKEEKGGNGGKGKGKEGFNEIKKDHRSTR